ncbi:hypothetical protein C8R45DRAFT_374042 [Mycena sanguinolenta]|nr:hypothetical protein C8R45DRAFT_374042 [Mycena sanguinolenta]
MQRTYLRHHPSQILQASCILAGSLIPNFSIIVDHNDGGRITFKRSTNTEQARRVFSLGTRAMYLHDGFSFIKFRFDKPWVAYLAEASKSGVRSVLDESDLNQTYSQASLENLQSALHLSKKPAWLQYQPAPEIEAPFRKVTASVPRPPPFFPRDAYKRVSFGSEPPTRVDDVEYLMFLTSWVSLPLFTRDAQLRYEIPGSISERPFDLVESELPTRVIA